MDRFEAEKRKCNRYHLPMDVDAVIGDTLIKSTARNISCSGLFLITRSPVNTGEETCVVFSLPTRDKPLKLKVKSVRVEPDGVAIAFHGMSPYFVPYFIEILNSGDMTPGTQPGLSFGR
ncbi:PilZ domain-containing protein [Desulfobacter sp.]|uniref:PilZ domain-containing protein n=1 Tax=Desulfobacter sp. TaxID=2294 RepID=UPI003D0C6D66